MTPCAPAFIAVAADAALAPAPSVVNQRASSVAVRARRRGAVRNTSGGRRGTAERLRAAAGLASDSSRMLMCACEHRAGLSLADAAHSRSSIAAIASASRARARASRRGPACAGAPHARARRRRRRPREEPGVLAFEPVGLVARGQPRRPAAGSMRSSSVRSGSRPPVAKRLISRIGSTPSPRARALVGERGVDEAVEQDHVPRASRGSSRSCTSCARAAA